MNGNRILFISLSEAQCGSASVGVWQDNVHSGWELLPLKWRLSASDDTGAAAEAAPTASVGEEFTKGVVLTIGGCGGGKWG